MPYQRGPSATEIRQAAQQLAGEARRVEAGLVALVREAADLHRPPGGHCECRRRSIGGLRRDIRTRLEVAAALPPEMEDLSCLIDDALILDIVLPQPAFDAGAEAIFRAIEASDAYETLRVDDYLDWPTYGGVDAVLRCKSEEPGKAVKARVRLRTAAELEELADLPELLEEIRGRQQRSEQVSEDFRGKEGLEVFYFADLLPELGFDAEHPAGLYCLLTLPDAQVGCHWTRNGFKPSSEVEAWIVGAAAFLAPIGGEAADAIVGRWSERAAASLPLHEPSGP